jgi:high-affinity iron transporter
MGSLAANTSPAVAVAASAGNAVAAPAAVKPASVAELTPPNDQYQAYAKVQLTALAKAVAVIEADLRRGETAQARQGWLTAQLDWERVGASYDSFGDLGLAVDGLPDGLPDGVTDPGFTGLHRLEYGLWHGQAARQLLPVATQLAHNVAVVQKNLTSDDLAGDPTQLSLRAHEIIEDAIRDHLSGLDDQGAGAAYAMTYADTQVDRSVLGFLAGPIGQRHPGLVARANQQLAALDQALLATRVEGRWQPLDAVSLTERQQVNAAIGSLVETLATVPDLLEVPVTH